MSNAEKEPLKEIYSLTKNLMYKENENFLTDQRSKLFNEREIKDNIRMRLISVKGNKYEVFSVFIIVLISNLGLLACIVTLVNAISHLISRQSILSSLGLIALVCIAGFYCYRIAYLMNYVFFVQLWVRFDKNSTLRVYEQLTRYGKFYTGNVTNVISGHDTISVYFSYHKHKEARYFTERQPKIGDQVVVLHSRIIAVII